MFPNSNNTNSNNNNNNNGSFTSKSLKLYNRFKGYNDDGSLKNGYSANGNNEFFNNDSIHSENYFNLNSGGVYNSGAGYRSNSSSIQICKSYIGCQLPKPVQQIFSKINSYYSLITRHVKITTIIQVIILFYLLTHTLDKFQRTDDSDSTLNLYRNNLCPPSNQANEDIINDRYSYLSPFPVISGDLIGDEMRGLDRNILCRTNTLNNSNDRKQFKKFIWIFVDSFAHDQAYEIIDKFQSNADTYRILNHGFKFSTAIYTSFFTGKIPTNYAGKPIQSDNIFYQFKRAGLKTNFHGPEFPAVALLGDAFQQHRYFEKYVNHVDDHYKLFSNVFGQHSFTPNSKTVFTALDQLTNQGSNSILLTTNLLDDKIHRKGKFDPPTLDMIQVLSSHIPLMKEWLASHPDYLFIMNSDHGGSKTGGVHEGELHGMKDNGNEGFMFFYNQEIKSNNPSFKEWLDTVDIAPTIASYFKGVNIPLESIGIVPSQRYQDSSINQTSLYLDLLLNTYQIRQLCKLKGFQYSESMFRSSIEYGTNIQSKSNQQLIGKIEELRNFIISIKDPMIEFKKFPSRYLFIMICIILFVQYINLKIEFKQGITFNHIKKNFFAIGLPYLFLYVDFLFLKFDYHKHFQKIFTFYLILISVTILNILQNLANNISIQQKSFLNHLEQLKNQITKNNSNTIENNEMTGQSSNNDNINNNNDNNSNNNNNNKNSSVDSTKQVSEDLLNNANNNTNKGNNTNGFNILDIPVTLDNDENSISTIQNNNNNNSKNSIELLKEYFENITPSNEWITSTSNIISYIMLITCLKDVIIEYFPMLYEGFTSFSFIINYIILLYQLRLLFANNFRNNNSYNNNYGPLGKIYSEINNFGGSYLIMVIFIFIFDMTGSVMAMQLVYFALLVKSISLILLVQTTEEIYMIGSLLLFILSTDSQRFFLLLFYLTPMYLLSGFYNERPKFALQVSEFQGSMKYLARMIALLMVILAFNSYIYMGGEFNMNVDVRSGGIGLINMEDYPTFSGFLMVYHKLGYFFVLITFLHRMSKSAVQEDTSIVNQLSQIYNSVCGSLSSDQVQQIYDFRYYLFRFLAQKSLIMMWIFNFNFWQYKDYLDCFIMTLIISIVAVGVGVLFAIDIIGKRFQSNINYQLSKISLLK